MKVLETSKAKLWLLSYVFSMGTGISRCHNFWEISLVTPCLASWGLEVLFYRTSVLKRAVQASALPAAAHWNNDRQEHSEIKNSRIYSCDLALARPKTSCCLQPPLASGCGSLNSKYFNCYHMTFIFFFLSITFGFMLQPPFIPNNFSSDTSSHLQPPLSCSYKPYFCACQVCRHLTTSLLFQQENDGI